MPPAIIDKGIATAGLLAYIVASNFCDSLPLYRQEKQFARIGVELSRRTMADWMIASSEACAPLMKVLEGRVRSGPLLQLDETTVQVMDEPGRNNTSLSYMWVARGGAPEAPVILYHYAPSRGVEVAKQMLGSFEGYLQTDGYEIYDRACEGAPNVVHAGCWSHVRRKFFEAHKSSSKGASAEVALSAIGKLYIAEGQRKLLSDPAAFAAERRRIVKPILVEFHAWLHRRASQVPPETLLGKAVNYALTQWPKLIRYLEHPTMTPTLTRAKTRSDPSCWDARTGCSPAARVVLRPARGCSASSKRPRPTDTNRTGTCEVSSRSCPWPAQRPKSWSWHPFAPPRPDSVRWGSAEAYPLSGDWHRFKHAGGRPSNTSDRLDPERLRVFQFQRLEASALSLVVIVCVSCILHEPILAVSLKCERIVSKIGPSFDECLHNRFVAVH